MDDTNSTLISAGNAPADVWALITCQVMISLFEEGFAPTSSKFKDLLEKTPVMIWGVIRTHMATKAIVKRDFKDHTITVGGTYAQWHVSNSGKKDALEAKATIIKLSTTVSNLKDSATTVQLVK